MGRSFFMLIDDAGADKDDNDYNDEEDDIDPVWLQIARKFCGK